MLLIYLKQVTTRSKFVFDFIFEQQFNIKYTCTGDKQTFDTFEGMKLAYADEATDGALHIKSSGFLNDDSLKIPVFETGTQNGLPIIFLQKENQFGFDIFSAVFYLLSRYEEHLPFTTDTYGRFPATESIAFRENFLHLPVVDMWIEYLAKEIQKHFPAFEPKSAQNTVIFTYDIDIAFKYKGRGVKRTLGASLKDVIKLNFPNLGGRVQTLSCLKKDPWNVYDYILKSTTTMETIFFFPVGNSSKYDRHLDFNRPAIQKLIHKLSKQTAVGLHASFTSTKSLKKIQVEKDRLAFICGENITKNRHHYLRISFPQTYLNLVAAGIREDYSLAYPEMPGFRAGTARPFYFYDLKNEEITALKIYSPVIMDATFEYYRATPDTVATYLHFLELVRKYNGTFICIWHNDLLSKPQWRNLHDVMVNAINKG